MTFVLRHELSRPAVSETRRPEFHSLYPSPCQPVSGVTNVRGASMKSTRWSTASTGAKKPKGPALGTKKGTSCTV
jgi:hypothetical protein